MIRRIYRTAVVILIMAFCSVSFCACSGEDEAAAASAEAETPRTAEDGAFSAVLKPADSWQADGKYFFKYELTVKNSGERDVTGWSIEIPLVSGVSVTDMWNCSARASGVTVTVIPEDYTKQLYPGQEKTGMGFIVSFPGETVIEDFSSEVAFGEETLIYNGTADAPAVSGAETADTGDGEGDGEQEETPENDAGGEEEPSDEAAPSGEDAPEGESGE